MAWNGRSTCVASANRATTTIPERIHAFVGGGLLAIALAASIVPATFADATNAASAVAPRHPITFTRSDAWFASAALASVAIAASFDQQLADQVPATRSRATRRLDDVLQSFGNPVLLGPALIAAWGVGHLDHDRELVDASERIGTGVVAAGLVTEAIKVAAGRKRPEDSPHDSHQFRPFSGNDSFPSGHATVAFAFATALDRETDAAWVPWVAYPVAAMVGYSRIRDRKHWLSDVAAGAVIGGWTSAKGDDFARWWMARHHATAVGWTPDPRGGALLTVGVRF